MIAVEKEICFCRVIWGRSAILHVKTRVRIRYNNWNLDIHNGCPAWYMTRASRSPVMAECHESEFTCYDGRCIPHSRRCDNLYDCYDFSDEQNCLNTGILFIFVLPHLSVTIELIKIRFRSRNQAATMRLPIPLRHRQGL